MDVSIRQSPKALLVHGNWFQFGPGERISHDQVESRMLLWGRAGKGTVVLNGETLRFSPGTFVILPWRHRIEYIAEVRNPFLVAGLHVIPRHDPEVPARYEVAHQRHTELSGLPHRGDVRIPALSRPISGNFEDYPALRQLAEYALSAFEDSTERHEPQLRMLGQLLLIEFQKTALGPPREPRNLPPEIQRLLVYIDDHLHMAIRIEDLLALSALSPATLTRLFRRHLGAPPQAWITARRIAAARDLLRTTRKSVAEVGEAVGYADPFHFSRVFSRQTGQSPLSYRKSIGIL